MASRAAARSGASWSSVELINTRTRWSGGRITEAVLGASVDRLSASSGSCVSIVNQALSRNDAFASIKRVAERWEADDVGGYLLPCYSLTPVSIVEDASRVTVQNPDGLRAQSFCSSL